jgi:hypothetical protein
MGVDRWILEIKHTQILPLLGLRLLLLLTIGRICVVGHISRSGGVTLVSPALFRARLGIGSRFASQRPATDLSVIPRTEVGGCNNALRNVDGEHGGLVKIDLITNAFMTVNAPTKAFVLSSAIRQDLDMMFPFPKFVAKSAKQLKICSKKF